jgi:hypothetical protein
MKKKRQSPHDEVKSYSKVAQDRLKEVFFTRPEWRKPKSEKQLDLFISRIDEIYYPFSNKDKHMVAVWRQVLKEKREEMLDELKAAAKIPFEKANNTEERRRGAESTSSACPLPLGEWPKARIAQLKADVRAARCGSYIAREIKASPSVISAVLNGTGQISSKKRIDWLDRISIAFIKRRTLIQSAVNNVVESKLKESPPSAHGPAFATLSDLKSIVDFPQQASTLISNMSVNIVGDKMHVLVTVDVCQAIQLYLDRATEKAVLGNSGDLLK